MNSHKVVVRYQNGKTRKLSEFSISELHSGIYALKHNERYLSWDEEKKKRLIDAFKAEIDLREEIEESPLFKVLNET